MEITVLDNGTGQATADGAGEAADGGGGHGLLGMRERVTALGGTLTTGPRYGGGFRVHAILPVKAPPRAARSRRPCGGRPCRPWTGGPDTAVARPDGHDCTGGRV